MSIRKILIIVEETYIEEGKEVLRPTRIAAAAAVVQNPLASRFVGDLSPIIDKYCRSLGELLPKRAIEALGITGEQVESFGKGVIVGLAGELEHGVAITHSLFFGNPFRKICGNAKSLLPSGEKRGPAGCSLDVLLKHKNDATTRSHHMSVEIRIPDAPLPDEIVVVATISDKGRPHARLPEFGDWVHWTR
jgi:hypothetical protein